MLIGYVMESGIEKLRQVGFTEYKAKAYLAQKW
jgi:sugar-specific transcriptional regulator TrmB